MRSALEKTSWAAGIISAVIAIYAVLPSRDVENKQQQSPSLKKDPVSPAPVIKNDDSTGNPRAIDKNRAKQLHNKTATINESNSKEKSSDLRELAQEAKELNLIRITLRPNVYFSKFNFTFEENELGLEHEVKNNGANEVNISAPIIQLSLTPIDGENKKNLLVEKEDYIYRAARLGKYVPGMSHRVAYKIIILNKNFLGKKLYYFLNWKLQTDPAAVASIRHVLDKYMNPTEINEVANFNQNFTGEITFAKSP